MTLSSLLATLVDFHHALETDRVTPLERRKARDRRMGATLERWRRQPDRQIRAWLDTLEPAPPFGRGHHAAQLALWLAVALALTGLLSGWGMARVVLHYDGSAPINLVHVLAVLLVPQWLLLAVWLLAALPRPLPGLQSLRDSLRYLNPGRLARAAALRFGGGQPGLEILWQRDNAVAMAPAARWLLSYWSQLFAVMFNLGVLATLFYLVSFSDLAFGWSTTLDVAPQQAHGVVQTLAWPWHGWLPEAAPGLPLVEDSRFFRLNDDAADDVAVARLGAWWPFVAIVIALYGLLPRLITLWVSRLRLRHHLRKALTRLPGAPELLARMNSPLVATASPSPEPVQAPTAHISPNAPPPTRSLRCNIATWSHKPDDTTLQRALRTRGIEAVARAVAGGARSIADDLATAEQLCARDVDGVAVVAKAWEPPLLEFLDFMRALRERCGAGQPLIILLSGDGRPVADEERAVWEQTLATLKDPELHVETLEPAP